MLVPSWPMCHAASTIWCRNAEIAPAALEQHSTCAASNAQGLESICTSRTPRSLTQLAVLQGHAEPSTAGQASHALGANLPQGWSTVDVDKYLELAARHGAWDVRAIEVLRSHLSLHDLQQVPLNVGVYCPWAGARRMWTSTWSWQPATVHGMCAPLRFCAHTSPCMFCSKFC